ncbi:MAG: DNA polymerase III subunit delta [Sphaerotilus natans subsp. sulfidivorans]|uniref:DNA polymerase III subunit delta n=1 Tax=Sphaerotilus sulfidivorans TaxID=639200 RepID=UPI0023537DE9|nr:DNA polymerase III subunit delta [Sphaerotilus sulfidivorans]MCK6402319.1 DNA polymerase III subunit delta [Sphaerotilus sulfidivorans]
MQIRAEQLAAALAKGLRPLYVIHGDEPLLAQEAADAVRAAARAAGCSERTVHTVAGGHFDWAGLLGDAGALSLFAERRLIEIRIPSGKPGKDGSEALQRYVEQIGDDDITLVLLPRLDRTQLGSAWFGALDGAGLAVRVDPVERRALPVWIAQRLAQHGLRVEDGEAGQQALAFFADRVEGNLLAAHQEIAKLALLHAPADPRGAPAVLAREQIEAAVLDVARYDVFRLGEAVLAGDAARALRMLDGLQAEGEAAVLVHWTLADDLRGLQRVHAAVRQGRPLPVALREARVWGLKEKLFERVLPRLEATELAALVDAAHVCDGIVKGLRDPRWPDDPWAALQQLVLMTLAAVAPRAGVPALVTAPAPAGRSPRQQATANSQ